jgi:hypothetical protein
VARGIQYGLIAEPDSFAGRAEQLGAGLLRVFLYWSQLEPERGRYDWAAVDALLEQVDDDTELWLMIGASSPWATVRSSDFLPASPPLDGEAYARLIGSLVEHCAGRVRWWQCENEPCKPLFWVGSATEYVAQLRLFTGAVRTADPDAQVVLGGCPPGVYPAEGEDRREHEFFQQLLDDAGDLFDAFDVHLYGDPYRIPATIADLRQSMHARDHDKPILVGEYNGPLPIQYPEALGALGDVFESGATQPWSWLSAHQFRTGKLSAAPARNAMHRLYERMADLPPQLQMFMTGCLEDLDDLRHRLNARDVVIRNTLALSCGIQRTVCWQIRPVLPAATDRYEFLRLMFDNFHLLPYDHAAGARFPCADAFAELSARVTGAETVRRCNSRSSPTSTCSRSSVTAAPPPAWAGSVTTASTASHDRDTSTATASPSRRPPPSSTSPRPWTEGRDNSPDRPPHRPGERGPHGRARDHDLRHLHPDGRRHRHQVLSSRRRAAAGIHDAA